MLRKTFFFLLAVLTISTTITSQSNFNDLQLLQENLLSEASLRKARINNFYNNASADKLNTLNTNLTKGWMVYDIVNGKPAYIGLDNRDAADAIGISKVNSNPNLNVDLQGEGIEIGIWDGGLIRTTHQDFAGRIKYFDSAGGGEFSFHATGVAGTLFGSGISEAAKGMAPKALGIAYDFNGDASEMVEAQMLKGLILSNHSYGRIAGWSDGTWFGDIDISDQEDWVFGFYDGQAKNWDDIAYNAPNYLIVKSAGNDRGDSGSGPYPADGPYDIIAASGTAKNILTVGAIVKSPNGYRGPNDIQMSSFSGWGPTDDGRIKPDIVGVGVSMRTAAEEEDDDYQTISGTSFSSPSVCGGLALVQEFYKQRFNKFLSATSLKALTIHTAMQAETAKGPSYRMGWGLLDVNASVEFLNSEDGVNRQLIESSLSEGQELIIELEPKSGSPLTATIVWLDPSGTPAERSLDPTDLMLVNDLDMVVEDEAGNKFLPYILDPSKPALAPTTGDNFRDNLEKIFVESLDPRKYFLKISHKGNISNGPQNFSLLIEYESENTGLENLYWVGNTGEWVKENAWSVQSGGTGMNITATENKKIIIDDNSVSGNGDVITLDKDYSIGSLIAITSKQVVLDLNGNSITTTGSIIAASDSLTIKNGTIICTNSDSLKSLIINLDKATTENLNILFDENNKAAWEIENSTMNVKSLDAKSGTLTINKSNVVVSSLISNPTSGSTIEILESNISGVSNFILGEKAILISDVNSIMTIDQSDETNIIDLNNKNILFPILIVGLDMTIRGEGNAYSLLSFNNSSAMIESSLVTEIIAIENSAALTIAKDISIDITSGFAVNNGSERVDIKTEDGTATINSLAHQKYCFDNFHVENVDLSGFSSITVGPNGSSTNASNWSTLACDDLLFANFSTDFTCLGSFADLQSTSEGAITAYEWKINGQVVSNKSKFGYTFIDLGITEIALTISDQDGNQAVWIKNVEVIENTLAPNEIVRNSTSLISKVLGDSYQWYLDDVAIDGAIERVFPYNWQQGVFFVVVFKNGCNIKSADLDLSTNTIDIGNEEVGININPNPFSDLINISVETRMNEDFEVSIIDIMGKYIYRGKISKSEKFFSIDLSFVLPGAYSIKLATKENTYVKRLIKQ